MVENDLAKTVIQKVLTTTDLHKVKSIDYKLFSKIINQMILNQNNFDVVEMRHIKEKNKWDELERNLRLLIKFLKQEKQSFLKKIDRVLFEKSWLESENFELRDKLETLKLKAAQGKLHS